MLNRMAGCLGSRVDGLTSLACSGAREPIGPVVSFESTRLREAQKTMPEESDGP